MKTACSLMIICVCLFTSCKKDIDETSQNIVQANAQADDLFGANNCLITHYYDDNFVTGYTLDISYNSCRQPDTVTINYYGTNHLVAHYDRIGRLSKVTFRDPDLPQYETFEYD